MKIINYSIIIPHKNTPDLLLRLLGSIPRREDLEIIIVDDNSSADVVDFKAFPGRDEERVTCIFNKQENKGAGHARNCGMAVATGMWLLFADSDDLYDQSAFLDTIDRHLNSDADIIYFGVDCVYSDDVSRKCDERQVVQKLQRYYRDFKAGVDGAEHNIRFNFTEPWAKMIRRELVQNHRILFDEVQVCNDYFFSVKTGHYARKIDVDSTKLYVLTHRPGSLSHGYADTYEKLMIRIGVAIEVIKFCESNERDFDISILRGLMVTLLKKYPGKFCAVAHQCRRSGINLGHLFLAMAKGVLGGVVK